MATCFVPLNPTVSDAPQTEEMSASSCTIQLYGERPARTFASVTGMSAAFAVQEAAAMTRKRTWFFIDGYILS